MSAEKVREALAASKDTYIRVPAGVLRDACAEVGPAASALGRHAQAICDGQLGNNGADTVMQIHREKHGPIFALKAVEAPKLEA